MDGSVRLHDWSRSELVAGEIISFNKQVENSSHMSNLKQYYHEIKSPQIDLLAKITLVVGEAGTDKQLIFLPEFAAIWSWKWHDNNTHEVGYIETEHSVLILCVLLSLNKPFTLYSGGSL